MSINEVGIKPNHIPRRNAGIARSKKAPKVIKENKAETQQKEIILRHPFLKESIRLSFCSLSLMAYIKATCGQMVIINKTIKNKIKITTKSSIVVRRLRSLKIDKNAEIETMPVILIIKLTKNGIVTIPKKTQNLDP